MEAGMSQETRFPLRISIAWRGLFLGVGLFCLFQGAVALLDLSDVRELGAALISGIAGFLVTRLVLRNSGVLIFREDGLVLDSHISTGFIPWANLQEPRPLRIWGMDYLALSTSDPDAYVDSRRHLEGLVNDGDRQWAQGLLRLAYVIIGYVPAAKKAIDAALTVCGWSKLPDVLDEASLMTWQQKNYGAQIVLQRLFVPDLDHIQSKLTRRWQAHRELPSTEVVPADSVGRARIVSERVTLADQSEAVEESTTMTLAGPHRSRAGRKPCPMCAELVQEQARVCRFCRYSFEENALLPPA